MFKKSLIFCVIFAIFAISINAQQNYPEYDEEMCVGIEDGALFGIPNECYSYYYCVEEVGYLDDCRNFCEGCQFDVALNDCNSAEITQCSVEEIPTNPPVTNPPVTNPPVTQTQTQAPTTTTTLQSQTTELADINCPDQGVVFLESENCTEYYICANGQKLTMRCMEGLVWNNEEKQCDHPIYNPRCSGISTDTANNVKCNRHGFYTTAYPFDCQKFVFCSEGIPMVQICPIGTAWNIDHCVDRRYAMCQDTKRMLTNGNGQNNFPRPLPSFVDPPPRQARF